MKDTKRNLVMLIIITVVISFISEYFHIGEFLFPILVLVIAIGLMITPFKFYDND